MQDLECIYNFSSEKPDGIHKDAIELEVFKAEMFQKLNSIKLEIFDRMDKIESLIKSSKLAAENETSKIHRTINCRTPLVDSNGQEPRPSIPNNENVQAVLANPKVSSPVQLGLELAKVLFTEVELATSSVTGRKINGCVRNMFDPVKMEFIDEVVKCKFSISDLEFMSVRSLIRDSIANRCKYWLLEKTGSN